MRAGADRPRRSLVSIAFDALVVLSLAIWLAIAFAGGFSVSAFGIVVSAHRAARARDLFLAAAVFRFLLFDVRGRRRRFDRASLRASGGGVRRWWRRLYQPSSEPPAGSLRLIAPHTLWAFAGLCAFGALLLHRQLAALGSVPDLGDPLLSIWRMGWVCHWLHGDPRPLFSPNIFYPERLTFTYSDSMLLPATMACPLLAAGLHPVVAYNLLFLAAFVFSGLAMYLLVAHLTGSPRAAFVSGLLFGFYPFRFEHYSHLELQMTMWMPLALLALHRFLESQRARHAIGAALAVAAQLYSSMYFAVFFCLYLVPVAGLLWAGRGVAWRRLWRGAVAACVLALVLAIPLARPYLAAQATKGERDVPAVTFYSAEAWDYLSPHFRSATYYGVLPKDRFPERALFPGLMALSLATVGLVPPLGVARLAYGAGLLLAFDASRGFHGITYPYLYEWLVPIRGMRVPARFSLIAGMTLAILGGFGTLRLLRRVRRPWGSTAVFAALIGAVAVDLRPNLPLEPVWREPPAIYASLANRPDAVLAEFPWWSDGGFSPQMPFMYFSLWHWTNMVNGASGFEPPHYQDFLEAIHRFPDAASIDALKARGVTHVTVNCALYGRDRDCHGVLDDLGDSPSFKQVARAQWQGDTVVLYELVK